MVKPSKISLDTRQTSRQSFPQGPRQVTSATAAAVQHPRALETILWGGLLAGFLDGMDAIVSVTLRGITIVDLFHYIASGLLGGRAFRGGLATAALGCVLHFSIATGAAAVYYLLSLFLPVLLRKPLLCGPFFGLGVYIFMHYIAVPLSAVPQQPPPTLSWVLNQLFSHTLFVGLPIALVRSWSARTRRIAKTGMGIKS